MPYTLQHIRNVVYAVVVLFSLIVLGLGAAIVHAAGSGTSDINTMGGFSLAIAVITMIWIGAVSFIEKKLEGGVVLWVATELAWLTVLWILWMSAAAFDSSLNGKLNSVCSLIKFEKSELSPFSDPLLNQSIKDALKNVDTICNTYKALQAFCWLNWIILLGWFCLLVLFAYSMKAKGHPGIWTAPVRDTDFYAADGSAANLSEKAPPAGGPPVGGFAPGAGVGGFVNPNGPQSHQYPPSSPNLGPGGTISYQNTGSTNGAMGQQPYQTTGSTVPSNVTGGYQPNAYGQA